LREKFLQHLDGTTDPQQRLAQRHFLLLEFAQSRLASAIFPFQDFQSRLQLFSHAGAYRNNPNPVINQRGPITINEKSLSTELRPLPVKVAIRIRSALR
jgi:hypothetical protein